MAKTSDDERAKAGEAVYEGWLTGGLPVPIKWLSAGEFAALYPTPTPLPEISWKVGNKH